MPLPSDSILRIKISDAIELVAPKAVIFSYWVLGHEQAQWPGLLRSPADLDAEGKGRVHGYVIRRRDSAGTVPGMDRVKRTYTYEILGLHYYYSGPEADNSEKLISAEIDSISDKFDRRKLLDPDLGRVEPITWRLLLPSIGGELLHLSIGTLVLEPCVTV